MMQKEFDVDPNTHKKDWEKYVKQQQQEREEREHNSNLAEAQ